MMRQTSSGALLGLAISAAAAACGPGNNGGPDGSDAAGGPDGAGGPDAAGGPDGSGPIPTAVTVTPNPALHSVATNAQYVFYATVNGGSNSAVTWSVSPASCGAIGATKTSGAMTSAVYTAPSSVPSASTCTVTATSVQDPSKSDSATVTIDTQLSVSNCDFAKVGVQQTCSTSWAGLARTFDIYIPTNYAAGNAMVLSLHPLGSSGQGWCKNATFPNTYSSGTDAMADAHGFIAVCPSAATSGPNAGYWDKYTLYTNHDDAGYLSAVAQYVESATAAQSKRADARQLFMFGFSNGTEALIVEANEYGDFFAAGVPYESSFYDWQPTRPSSSVPAQAWPISLLLIRGNGACANYNNCPYATSGWASTGSFTASTNEFFAHFSQTSNPGPYIGTPTPPGTFLSGPLTIGGGVAGCTITDTPAYMITQTPQTSQPQTFVQTTPDVTEKKATGCAYGVEVQMLKLMGGIHEWYGTMQLGTSACTATSSPPCNPHLTTTTGTTLNDIVWNFLAAHPKA